jgi:hypothetical protein
MFTEGRQDSSQPKVRDENPFLLGDIKKYSLNGLNGLYHPMQLTDCLSEADAHWSDQNLFCKNQF